MVQGIYRGFKNLHAFRKAKRQDSPPSAPYDSCKRLGAAKGSTMRFP